MGAKDNSFDSDAPFKETNGREKVTMRARSDGTFASSARKTGSGTPEPTGVAAEAFAQGLEIHIAPGTEEHLPHEAWHLVQQSQGRVKAAQCSADGTRFNENPAAEAEASAIGDNASGAASIRPEGG
jgi:hypothetical protein